MEGTIVKAVADFYYVRTDERVWQCKARGLFRKKGITPLVGDKVEIEETLDEEAVINEIYPRKNAFVRPAVANVDRLVVVVAAARPEPVLPVIDKFMVMAEYNDTEVALCINKADLAEGDIIERLESIYQDIYPVYKVSAVTGQGVQELKDSFSGKHVALAGSSGVGKSTLLNAMEESAGAETGDVSKKTKRGRHTTRHVELFRLDNGGFLYDTPGFTSFDIQEADEEELHHLYPEMRKFIGQCKYDNCRHLNEPGCAVKDAVEAGLIDRSRYGSYVSQMEEIKNARPY